ncbi:MAG: pyruvate dehydrogenase complex dihydrolipoamide acetyltransferase [Candidatus Paracaedibacteraceae bacterium]|nr:pyruvate dehydrogenase complex dihydrolipoamide acetyltransferase [Candidatus Paracaedibacteraceae bacterium]
MPIQILMPALSPTMTEGNLVKWHKAEGDTIKAGQLLAEIETDKATMEIEAVDEGTLGRIIIPEGTENVKVNALIGLILETGEDKATLDSFKAPEAIKISTAAAESAPTTPATLASTSSSRNSDERVYATPLARRIATQQGIDLHDVDGSGPRGRIVKADIENFTPATKTCGTKYPAAAYVDLPMNNMRKTIAKRLTESKQTIPHFYLTIDCDIDKLLALRAEMNALPKATQKLSVNDFIIRACALALHEVPEANATFHDTFVRQYSTVDIAVAVAIDGGLVTPVIRSAEQKQAATLSTEMKSLAERARAGKLKPEEYQGGGFTLSNLGMFGIKHFGAIINPPQASIMAVGAGEKRAVVKNDQLAIATMMSCTLSVDHRAIDGAVGSKFLNVFKELIENPLMLFQTV